MNCTISTMDEVSLNSEPVYDDEVEEFEIDGECAMTEYVGQNGNIMQGENPLPPAVGMEFESYDDVYYFYNCYAKEQGFGVRVSNTWYRKSKEKYRGKLSCSSAGFKKKSEANRPRPETRTGCPAMIKYRLMENKRWRIIEVELDHNHLMNPISGKFYKSHRMMGLGSKRPLLIDNAEEVPKIRLFRTVVIDSEESGILNFDEGVFRNDVDLPNNQLNLKPGDAQEMLNFFAQMQLMDPNFFYVMDLDEKGRLRNVFWAEARCRAAYGYFGDVMMIDTRSLSDKYKVPLLVFTGINHHGQSVSFGCGLVANDAIDSFIWLFRAWITYMVGRPPQTIITDQSKSLKNAVMEVFPRAFHGLSLPNIMKKVPDELEGLQEYDSIRMAFTSAVYHSLRADEFEASWNEMVRRHGMGDHKWLQALYEDRKQWAPVYFKETFFAGAFPLKQDESLASPFEGYLDRHTSIKDFLNSYDKAVQEAYKREALCDLESMNSSCVIKSRFYFELQLSKLYTNDIMKKFQDEIEGMYSSYSTRQINIDGPVVTYLVKEDIQVEENTRVTRNYEVTYNASAAEVICLCGLFNFKGYLCRHALSVISQIGLEEIPPQYILTRWRKDIKRAYIYDYGRNGIDINSPVHRYDNLYKSVVKVAEAGRKSYDRYKFTLQALNEILNKVHLQEDYL
ncbi:FAR1-RELATED SEQUENCE 6-like [Olea europaea subsp. europaea]|uniref:Protein FAR1-RELATED SEQUENCE n=1 Tax=Olea europaea subsp. europaea TaxID=158383 RepID=A0A8S0SRV2_OLEEU|nr:FAR1-RELATED SEQUENCE 6-like [Olea europaea subsp. europaea]